MKALEVINIRNNRVLLLAALTLTTTIAASAAAPRQVILARDSQPEGEIKGPVDLVVSPGFDDARVTIIVDGQKIAEGVLAPYHIPMDFGALPVEHKIVVT